VAEVSGLLLCGIVGSRPWTASRLREIQLTISSQFHTRGFPLLDSLRVKRSALPHTIAPRNEVLGKWNSLRGFMLLRYQYVFRILI
jgi:hypothetical protein